MYYDTTSNLLKWWDGTKWQTAGTDPSTATIYDSDQIGTVKSWTGKTIPTNWALANGTTLNEGAGYFDLANWVAAEVAAGNTLWAISGSAPNRVITLPDLRRKFIYGANSLSELGQAGGETAHVLTQSEMPAHAHPVNDPAHAHVFSMAGAGAANTAYPGGAAGTIYDNPATGPPTGIPLKHNYTGLYLSNTGGDVAHNNLPPYVLMALIVKVAGATINAGGALVGPQGPKGDPGGANYTATIGDGSSLVFTITHNLNSLDVVVTVREATGNLSIVYPEIQIIDVNSVRVIFDVAIPTNSYRVVVGGLATAGTFLPPPLVTSLPSSPADGQIVYYLADATLGLIWPLRYRAASASPYKWEAAGDCPPLYAESATLFTTASTTSVDTGNQVTVPLAGDYWLSHGTGMLDNTGTGYAVTSIFTSAGDEKLSVTCYCVSGGDAYPAWQEGRVNALTAGSLVKNRLKAMTAGTARWNGGRVAARPLRVG
jgi:microcystin-dependent protein